MAIIVHDPYEEMAERLLIFKRLGADALEMLNDRDSMMFAPIVAVVGELASFDERELRRVMGKTDPRALMLLSDPLTRQIVCADPNEPARRGAVSKTLRTLSEFDLVGIRRRGRMFSEALSELLGIPTLEIAMQPSVEIGEIARNLRAVSWIEGLIENDLEVYQSVAAAFKAVADPAQGNRVNGKG
jgi:hypothetical protein